LVGESKRRDRFAVDDERRYDVWARGLKFCALGVYRSISLKARACGGRIEQAVPVWISW
jgi:hypothetical protein